MTDNKLWDTIIEPIMNVNLIPTQTGRVRGIRMSYCSECGEAIEISEYGTNNIGTNYKKARQNMINEVRKTIQRSVS